jgi:hypothetical protein
LRHSDDGTLVVERYGHPTREGDRAHPPPYGDNLRPLAPVSGDSRGTGARDCGLDRDVRRVDPSGRATVTGDGSTAAGDAILTGRLTAAGAPDPSFGTADNGRVVIPGTSGDQDTTCGAVARGAPPVEALPSGVTGHSRGRPAVVRRLIHLSIPSFR